MNTLVNDLVNFLVSFSQQQLAKYGEFYPHAARINTRDEIEVVGVHTGDDYPLPETLIGDLTGILVTDARTHSIRAAAICSDVRIGLPSGGQTDAIRVELEHKDGESLTIHTPYLKQENGQISYGLPIVEQKDRIWFI